MLSQELKDLTCSNSELTRDISYSGIQTTPWKRDSLYYKVQEISSRAVCKSEALACSWLKLYAIALLGRAEKIVVLMPYKFVSTKKVAVFQNSSIFTRF
jgi:hypothetical protein